MSAAISTRSAGAAGGLCRPESGDPILAEVEKEVVSRLTTGSSEFDRVLGGGLVAGSVVILGGDPGIGKSTLLLQVAAALGGVAPVLYITGKESLAQVNVRARRLGYAGARVRLVAETCVEQVLTLTAREKSRVLVIDSIQTMFSEALQSAPADSNAPCCRRRTNRPKKLSRVLRSRRSRACRMRLMLYGSLRRMRRSDRAQSQIMQPARMRARSVVAGLTATSDEASTFQMGY